MKYLFSQTHNLLLNRHDRIVQKFIDGVISYQDFENYEKKYLKIKELFTINLN